MISKTIGCIPISQFHLVRLSFCKYRAKSHGVFHGVTPLSHGTLFRNRVVLFYESNLQEMQERFSNAIAATNRSDASKYSTTQKD